eukprot:1235140-Pyramimonas_sp.AAC.1
MLRNSVRLATTSWMDFKLRLSICKGTPWRLSPVMACRRWASQVPTSSGSRRSEPSSTPCRFLA